MDTKFRERIATVINELSIGTSSGYEPSKDDIIDLLLDILKNFDEAVVENENTELQGNLDEIHYISTSIDSKTEEIDDIIDEMLMIYPDFEEQVENIKWALSEIDDKANEIYNLSC